MNFSRLKFLATAILGALILASTFSVSLITRAETAVTNRLWLPLILSADPISPHFKNPDFELGKSGWNFYSTQGGDDIITIAPIPRGYYSARLGSNFENYRWAYISQIVEVPAGKPWLTFWYFVDTQENYCPQFARYDYISVQVNGFEVHPIALCNDAEHLNFVWLKMAINLSNFQGMKPYLKIEFKSDGTMPSDIYLDDFRFE